MILYIVIHRNLRCFDKEIVVLNVMKVLIMGEKFMCYACIFEVLSEVLNGSDSIL